MFSDPIIFLAHSKTPVNRHPSVQSATKSCVSKTYIPCPLRDCESFSIKSNEMIISFVISLFYWCRPLTIANGIIAIIINPIKGVYRCGLSTQVIEELFIGCIQELDTSPSIICISRIIKVVASTSSSLIATILASFVSLSMLKKSFTYLFTFQAPTTIRSTIIKVACRYNYFLSTFAKTIPILQTFIIIGFDNINIQYMQSSKYFTNKVLEISRLPMYSTFVIQSITAYTIRDNISMVLGYNIFGLI